MIHRDNVKDHDAQCGFTTGRLVKALDRFDEPPFPMRWEKISRPLTGCGWSAESIYDDR